MSNSSTSSPSPAHLTATYTSPTSPPFTLSHSIPGLPSPYTTDEKTAYLHALRAATAELQASINSELTARMEEDKARLAVEGGGTAGLGTGKGQGVDDEVAEETYGEEGAEDDE